MRELYLLFCLTSTTFSVWLNFTIEVLHSLLRTMNTAAVRLPTVTERESYAANINKKYPTLIGVWGFIDGLNLSIGSDGDANIQNAYYNGWYSDTCISNLFVFAADGTVSWMAVNAPGSWHDAAIATRMGLYDALSTIPWPYVLLGDAAFPVGLRLTDGVKIIRAPKESEAQPASRAEYRHKVELTQARQSAEWGMRDLQGGFVRFKQRWSCRNAEMRKKTLQVLVGLHNHRVRTLGTGSHIHTTWMGGQDQDDYPSDAVEALQQAALDD
jgi:hypothetical protein